MVYINLQSSVLHRMESFSVHRQNGHGCAKFHKNPHHRTRVAQRDHYWLFHRQDLLGRRSFERNLVGFLWKHWEKHTCYLGLLIFPAFPTWTVTDIAAWKPCKFRMFTRSPFSTMTSTGPTGTSSPSSGPTNCVARTSLCFKKWSNYPTTCRLCTVSNNSNVDYRLIWYRFTMRHDSYLFKPSTLVDQKTVAAPTCAWFPRREPTPRVPVRTISSCNRTRKPASPIVPRISGVAVLRMM